MTALSDDELESKLSSLSGNELSQFLEMATCEVRMLQGQCKREIRQRRGFARHVFMSIFGAPKDAPQLEDAVNFPDYLARQRIEQTARFEVGTRTWERNDHWGA